jgi:hypothetical protein
MKKSIFKSLLCGGVLLFAAFATKVQAQSNNGINFQAVARDNFSNPAKDRKLFIQSSIIQNVATGTKVLVEDHEANTDASGVFSISIGQGVRKGGSASNLASIDWTKGPYLLNIKIAISPIAPASDWDYTKEWIDLGTTTFGTVPYALFAGSVAGFDNKLNSLDTAKMLAPYAKVINLNSLVTNKVNIADSLTQYVTPTQLAAKTFDQTPILNSIATKLNIADSLTKYVTPTQLAAKTFDSTAIYNQLALKASKTYVDAQVAGATIADADASTKGKLQLAGDLTGTAASPTIANSAISTNKVADGAITNAKIASGIDAAKINGNISGNAATATKIATPVTINGVAFDGSSNITISSAAANSLIMNNSGTGDNSGSTFDGSSAKTISYNSIGASPLAGSSSLTTVGTITSGIWNGSTIAVANGGTGQTSLPVGRIIFGNGVNAVGSSSNLFWNNTTNSLGIGTSNPGNGMNTKLDVYGNASFRNTNSGKALLIDGDAGSNYSRIYTDANSGTPDDLVLGTYPNGHMNQLFLKQSNGFVGIKNSNPTTALDVTGTVTASGFSGPLTGNVTGSLNGNAATATKLAATKNINGIAFDGSSDITVTADANTLTGTSLASNVVNSSLTTVGTITSGVWSGTAISNNKLANSSLTIGSTNIALGASSNTLAGLSTVTSTNFTGNLIGNASTATKIANPVTINGVSFDGSSNITIASAAANALTINNSGNGDISGTTFDGSATKTISYNSIGASPLAGSSSLTTVGTITTGVWSGTAIANNKLANSSLTIGSTNIDLGASSNTLAGLSTVTSSNFTGNLTGDVTGNLTGNAATATKLATARNINGVSFDGTSNITIAADANTLTGTTLANNVVNSSLTSVGTITSGVWSGTAISNNKLANSSLTIGSTNIALGASSNTLAGLSTVTSTNFTGNLIGNASTATKIANPVTINGVSFDGSSNITIASAAANSLTMNNSGTGDISGSTFDGSTTKTISYNTIGASPLAGSSSLTTVGTITSGTWSGSIIDIAHGGTGSSTVIGAKTNLGLNNVENTALSTWAGSSNITTVGALTAQTKTFMFQDLILGYGANNGAKIQTDASNKYLSFYPNYNIESTRMWPSGNVTIQHGGTFTDNGYALDVKGSSSLASVNITNSTTSTSTTTGALVVAGGAGIAGDVNIGGSINSGTWSGSTIAIEKGGTGATTASAARSNLGLVIGTNVQSPITLGATSLAAGGTFTSLTGLSSVGATNFTGNLTGNVTGNLTGDVTGNLAGNATTATTAGNITATSNSTLTSLPSLVQVGTITSGVWSGTAIANNKLANSSLTIGSTNIELGASSNILAGLSTVTSTNFTGNLTGDVTGNLTGNAVTATRLATARNINGVSFDGTSNITIAADANTLTGTTLASNVLSSSLTSVGTITSGTWSGSTIAIEKGGTGATTASAARSNLGLVIGTNVQSPITLGTTSLAAGGTFTSVTGLSSVGATNFTGNLTGNVTGNVTGDVTGNLAGNATTATTAGNITATSNSTLTSLPSLVQVGTITSGTWSGTAVAYDKLALTGNIKNTDISTSAAIADTKLATITTAGKVLNSATTATDANTASAIVARDASGNFTASTITATISGTASTANKLTTARNINGVSFDGTSNITIAAEANTLSGTTLASNVVSSSLTSVGTITSGTWSGSTIAIEKGGTGATSASAARSNLGLVIGTNVQSPITLGTTSLAAGGTFTSVTGLSSVGATNFTGNLTGNVTGNLTGDVTGNLAGNATTATTAGNITATSNNTLTSLPSLVQVGTITTGVWSGTAIADNKIASALTGKTYNGLTLSSVTNGFTIAGGTTPATLTVPSNASVTGTNTGDQTITLTGDITGSGTSTFTTTLANSGVAANTYGSSTLIPSLTVDAKGRVTLASTASIIANAGTLTGTSLNSTVTGSSLTSVGTITSGTWSGSTIAVANGGTGVTTSTGSGSVVLNTSPSITSANLTTPNIGVANGTSLSLSSTLAAGASTFSSTVNVSGATTLTTLTASGNSTLTTLSAGATTLASSTITGSETIAGSLGVSGTTTLAALTTTGAATISATLTIPTGAGAGKVLTSDANGGASWKNAGGTVTSTSSSTTYAASSNITYIIFTGTASQTISLPTASAAGNGREYTIKNISSASVTIDAGGSNIISDSLTTSATSVALGIEPSNNWMKLISDGTKWYVIRALF